MIMHFNIISKTCIVVFLYESTTSYTIFIQIKAPSQMDACLCFLTRQIFKILGMMLEIKVLNSLKWSKFAFC